MKSPILAEKDRRKLYSLYACDVFFFGEKATKSYKVPLKKTIEFRMMRPLRKDFKNLHDFDNLINFWINL